MHNPLVTLVLQYRYVAIIPIAIIEGPVLSIVCGLLIRYGYFDFWPLFIILMAADLIGDVWWYYVGYIGGPTIMKSKFGKHMHADKLFEAIKKLYRRHHGKILVISKLTMGLGLPALVLSAAGALKIPFRKYIFYNAMGQIFWTGGLVAIGYFLGNLYDVFNIGLHWVSIGALIVACLIIFYFVGRYFRQRTLESAQHA